jgi:hypothetical protein
VPLSGVTYIFLEHDGDKRATKGRESVSLTRSRQPSVSRPLGN